MQERPKLYERWVFFDKRVRNKGTSVLFAGGSGRDRTMAVEVLAGDLQLPLYHFDLSAMVNKYIGETEKNLKAIFDAAESNKLILFFDEADALFGKRTEVRGSHDRYANIKVSYLLQRMETFRGLTILATSRRAELDIACVQRMGCVVEFLVQDSTNTT